MRTTALRIALLASTVAIGIAGPAQAADSFGTKQWTTAQIQRYTSARADAPTDLRGEAAAAAGQAPAPVVVDIRRSSSSGLDWSAFGIGAGAGLALAGMCAGGVLAASRRSRTSRLA